MSNKTLYELLEVSENASPEVVEKAYKILVKKYHPDLQPPNAKKQAEEKMKEINDAYEILGDTDKRKKYDEELALEREKIRQQQEMKKANSSNNSKQTYATNYTKNAPSNTATNVNNTDFDYEKDRLEYENRLMKEEIEQRKKMQENLNKEYVNAYNDYLRSLGYKVKEGWTKEKTKDLLIVISIIIAFFIILWIFPPTRNWLIEMYESNNILRTIVNIIVSIVTGLFRGIWNFITGLFD